MRKFFLFALLVAATMTMFAATKVETFTPQEGNTATYVTTETSRTCDQATWTFFSGGILTGVGNFSTAAAVIRAKKSSESVTPYIYSSTISGGIDSLWLTWNANGNESTGTWNIKVYINNVEVGALNMAGTTKDATPNRKFGIGSLGIEGDFTIKFVNESPNTTNSNFMRFVFDDLSWTTYGAPEKEDAGLAFAKDLMYVKTGAEPFVNALTNNSDATPAFGSSNPEVATVAEDGTITIVGLGTTTITATVAETDTYKADEATYVLHIVPTNFNIETFTGAHNVDMSGNATYLTEATKSFEASETTGLKWTTLLGSIRNNLGGGTLPPASNIAAVIRGKKSESDYGYLLSETIHGGIDSLAFDWTCNGTEADRTNPWNIKIYINDVEVGAIKDACTAIPATPNRFSVGNLKIDGDFTIKIVNLNDADDATKNHYRWVVDNIEWYSYEAPCEPSYGIMVDGENYIAGVKNEAQTEWLEYKIDATLKANQTFVIYDKCMKAGFMAGQDNDEANYKFNYTEGGTAFVVPQDGKYTIYLKMYGPDNNWLWTSRSDIPAGIENAMLKADVRKAVENGMVVIYRNGVRYNLQGQNF